MGAHRPFERKNLMTSTSLARRHVDVFGDVQLQQLWLATQLRSWRSLAVVSATPGVQTIEPATTLARMAWRYSGESTSVFDLRDVSLRLVEHELREINTRVAAGDLVFVALRSMGENPATIPVARAADALILCVVLGKSKAKAAQKTIDAIGRARFIGSILVDSAGQAKDRGGSGR